jgi:hypothetical protein
MVYKCNLNINVLPTHGCNIMDCHVSMEGKQVEEANKRGETKDNATNQERLAK